MEKSKAFAKLDLLMQEIWSAPPEINVVKQLHGNHFSDVSINKTKSITDNGKNKANTDNLLLVLHYVILYFTQILSVAYLYL